MINVEGAVVTLDGHVNEIVSELMIVVVSLLKAGVPQVVIEESFKVAFEVYERHEGELDDETLDLIESDKERECQKSLAGIKDTFRKMNDDAKQEIVKAMMEVMKEDD